MNDKTPLRRYKEARLAKKIKTAEAIEIFGVSQPTLSAWESGRKSPSIDALILMAKTYRVSVDYLLGVDDGVLAPKDIIHQKNIVLFHGKPVWHPKYGWAIVDAPNNELVFADTRLMISDNPDLYASAIAFSESTIPSEPPLSHTDLKAHASLWIEPISMDENLRSELRGYYTVKNRYVENEFGNRFYFDTYESKWLAFQQHCK